MRLPATLLHILIAGPALGQDPQIQRLGDELVNSRDMGMRRKAAQSLGRASGPQAVRLLATARRVEPKVAVRLAILRALRAIAFLRYPGYREALSAIGEAANDDFEADELIRLRATQALWEAGEKDLLDPVPMLDRQLSDRSPRLQLAAVKMLRKHGKPPVIDVLGRAAQDKTLGRSVRLKAIEALGAVALSEGGVVGREIAAANMASTKLLGIQPVMSSASVDNRHGRQIQLLAAVVEDPDNGLPLVLRAIKSIGQVKDKSAIPVLQQIVLTHPHDGIRMQAAGVLSHVMARQYE